MKLQTRAEKRRPSHQAHSFYEARSFEGGHELDDWSQAEAQVNQMPQQNVRGSDASRQAT